MLEHLEEAVVADIIEVNIRLRREFESVIQLSIE